MKTLEIVCTACGAETLVRREPVYEGFKKTGEQFVCVDCGHAYASEDDVPFKERKSAKVFSDDDLSPAVDVFDEDEKWKNCRYCIHYVVNPFTQRCSLHVKQVAATDLCEDFERQEDADEPPQTEES